MLELNKIYLQDCLDGMKLIEDKSVNMILCDLPYGTTKCKWDVIIPFDKLWTEYNRIIKSNSAIILFSSQPFTSQLISSNINNFKYCWVWDKVKPNGHLVAKHRPMQRTEDICVFGNDKIKYFPIMTDRDKPKQSKEYTRTEIMGGNKTDNIGKTINQKYPQNILTFSNASQKDKLHPTQKIIGLCEYLIKTYSNEGDLILDNCIGSGTTALACINLKRKFIGFENNEKYYKIARDRIGQKYE